jgi:hypothetical protein
MIGRYRRATLQIAMLLLPGAAGWSAVPNPAAADRDAPTNPPADPVRMALQAEAGGDNPTRYRLLESALHEDADNAAVRWQLGYVRSGEEWVPYAQSLDSIAERRSSLHAYAQSRAGAAQDSAAEQLALADRARELGLPDEERAHLRRVIALDGDEAEARRRLGDVRINGFWVTQEEVVQFARDLATTRIQRNVWDPRVQPIVKRLFKSQQAAWEKHWRKLTAIRDPAAISSMEAALADGDERAALWYLDWLAGVDAWEGSAALARQAVWAPSASIRSAAQERLSKRRVDDYAPMLLGSLRGNPQIAARLSLTPFGGLMYVEHLAYETQSDLRVRNLAVIYGPELGIVSIRRRVPPTSLPGTGRLVDSPELLAAAVQHVRRYYGALTASEGRDAVSGLSVVNDRITRTMSAATGLSNLASPQDCWEWWNDYQQVYVSSAKPLLKQDYEETWTVDRRSRRATRTPRRDGIFIASCFAAGTPVVTEYGPKPIEAVQLGDRVLSQDVETGELAFKPVFVTTVRPPVPLLKITTDRGELICTGGHPFWVNGESWLYARELQPGMRFHSVDGASEVLSVEDDSREEKAYNLIVADFHTYFAGEGRILSHDNTPRAPTNALVPGLMPDYASAEPAP